MLMIGVCVVLMTLGCAAMIVGGYLIAAHRVRAAADLAALSAATTASLGGEPCAAARRNAGAQGARIDSCERVGDQIDFVVTVTASVAIELTVPGLPRRVAAVAHAGSAEVRTG